MNIITRTVREVGVQEHEQISDQTSRTFHTRWEISKSPRQDFRRPIRESSTRFLKDIGDCGAQIVEKIFAIPGINGVNIRPYAIEVNKSPMFTWEELEANIISAVRGGDSIPSTLDEIGDTSALDEDFHRGLTE